MRRLCATIALLTALSAPAAAVGKTVPPGNAGADQYTETLPGPGGNDATGGGGGGSNQALSPAAQQKLEQLGPAGQATANLAQSTAPPKAKRGQGQGVAGKTANGESSGVSDVLKQAGGDGSGGMGLMLPLILVGTALAGVAFVLSRRRGGPGPGDPEGAG